MPDESPSADPVPVAYPSRVLALPAFDLLGFTQFVQSGGVLYEAVRHDGRWEELRRLAGEEGSIYGVASHDEACPSGHYRYTMAVKSEACPNRGREGLGDFHPIHIPAAEWVAFLLTDFEAQYGAFWSADPYRLIRQLGWEFNAAVGLHLDVYGPSYHSDHDAMEFLMPVCQPR